MNKRRTLGQHFLNSKNLAKTIVLQAQITKDDIVLEIGTGLGILTPLLCENARQVFSIEADEELYNKAKTRFSNIANLELKHGDGFKIQNNFSIFVSNLPYSKSKEAIEWLAKLSFSHGVITVQKEFAEKLVSKTKKRKAISVIGKYCFEIKKIKDVDKKAFFPPPNVDSVILQIIKKQSLSTSIIQTINKIFSYRRKTLQNIYKQFGKEINSTKRLDEFSEDELVEIAKKLNK